MDAHGKDGFPVHLYEIEKNDSNHTVYFSEVWHGRVKQRRRCGEYARVNHKDYPIRPAKEFHSYLREAAKQGYEICPPIMSSNWEDYEPLEFVVLPDPNTRRAR